MITKKSNLAALVLIVMSICLGTGSSLKADPLDDLLKTAEKAEQSTTAVLKNIQKVNRVASKEPEMEDNVVLPAAGLLRRMPAFLAGWMQWRDQKTKIFMALRINKRRIDDGWVVFEGGLAYQSAKDKSATKSFGILKIDPITGSMIMLERTTAKQENFDTSGKFVGTIDPSTLTMTGTWSKKGYARKADFELGPVDD